MLFPMAATIPVEFADGPLKASGTVTIRLGDPLTVDGKLKAPVYVDLDDLKIMQIEDDDQS